MSVTVWRNRDLRGTHLVGLQVVTIPRGVTLYFGIGFRTTLAICFGWKSSEPQPQ